MFIYNPVCFICQLNKMAHIVVALFETILGRSLHICAYMCTEQWVTCSLRHPCGSVKSASEDWTILGVKLFQRLELLRNLALGTVVSQASHSSLVIATMPWHYSHHCNYISILWLLSALVLVPQTKIKAKTFLIACCYQGPTRKAVARYLWANSSLSLTRHVPSVCAGW